jgi:DNA topoisomerase-1
VHAFARKRRNGNRQNGNPVVPADSLEAAEEAGLRYVSDTQPGYTRKANGDGFEYFDTDKKPIRDEQRLLRISRLAIPPAWSDVWICPSPNGHIQATGRDARARKQYGYHERWREVRDENKYDRMISFGKALPKIGRQVQEDLALPGLPRNKVLATIVQLLQRSFIRVGNEEYARENKSFGLTTMKDRHVDVRGSKLHFRFRGKSGRPHEIAVTDRRIAKIVLKLQDLPGQVLAAITLTAAGAFETKKQAKANIKTAIETVAKILGNTPAICRKCYIHPFVLETYLSGNPIDGLKQRTREALEKEVLDLAPAEAAVLKLLQGASSKKVA